MKSDLFEHKDIDSGRLGWITAGFVGLLILACVCSALYFFLLKREVVERDGPILSPLATRMKPFPAPALEVRPREALSRLRADEEKRLASYGWIDKKGAALHIPIEKAVSLVAERGIPSVGGKRTWVEMLQERGSILEAEEGR